MLGLTEANSINVDISTFSFYGENPYTEIYFRIDGKSVEWKKSAQNQMANANIVVILYNNDKAIVAYDKFSLNSGNLEQGKDFIGVRRMKILPGRYTLKAEVEDANRVENKIEMEQVVFIEPTKAPFLISDILILGDIHKDSSESDLVKNGFYMEPLPYSYSVPENKQLNFYIEVYIDALNKPGSEYFVQYQIMDGFMNSLTSKSLMSKYRKLAGTPVEPLVLSFPETGLRSGEYHISVSIMNKNKEILKSVKKNFIKSNPEADIAFLESYNDSSEHSFVQKLEAENMDYILKAHLPLTDQNQVLTLGELIKSNRIKSQRQFIFQFWKSKSPANPEEGYRKYMEVADAVDKKFYNNVGYGFQSDRGHIFLKYGKPSNVLTVDTELDAPPYEIWYYNVMPQTHQTNVRFLFYNPSLVHNDFRLLHSTCLGERINPSWETELYKSVPAERLGNTVDATQVGENWNRNARRYFNQF